MISFDRDRDTFVIQLSAAGLASDSVLGWLNGSNQWVNAGTNFISGAYNDSLTLGNFGYDSGTSSLWAVVNHGGSFTAVPEPTSALAGMRVKLARKRSTVVPAVLENGRLACSECH